MTPHPNPSLPGGHQARRPDTSPTPEGGPSADSSLVRGRVRRFRQRRPVLAALVFAGALAAAALAFYLAIDGLTWWLESHLSDQSPQAGADFRLGLPVTLIAVLLVLTWLFSSGGRQDESEDDR